MNVELLLEVQNSSHCQCLPLFDYGGLALFGNLQRNYEHQETKNQPKPKPCDHSRTEQMKTDLFLHVLYSLLLHQDFHCLYGDPHSILAFKADLVLFAFSLNFDSVLPLSQILWDLGPIPLRNCERDLHPLHCCTVVSSSVCGLVNRSQETASSQNTNQSEHCSHSCIHDHFLWRSHHLGRHVLQKMLLQVKSQEEGSIDPS